MPSFLGASLFAVAFLTAVGCAPKPQPEVSAGPVTVRVNWDKKIRDLKTRVQAQVCVEPPMRRESPIHKPLFAALRDLRADWNRFQPWHPYPRLSVAELEPPRDGKTSWDFSLLDPIMADFMETAAGHPVVVNLSPIPQWMFVTDKPVPYPRDPDEITWTYSRGTELRDKTGKEVADYFARLAGWYTKGGFTDEYGKPHESSHKYKFDFWEVLNEIDIEHNMTPQFYTALYDEIVGAIRRVNPELKFGGLALANPGEHPEYFHYFLDPGNHKKGVPVDSVSFHFYAMPNADEPKEVWPHTYFAQADRIIHVARHIEALRNRLSPKTAIHINEIGSMLPDPQNPKLAAPIPQEYWNLSGALFAYIYLHLSRIGVDAASLAELIDYPGQFAATTMLDWETGKRTARYQVLKMIREQFTPGDMLVDTQQTSAYVAAQAFEARAGNRKVLLVNKRNRTFSVSVPGATLALVVNQQDAPAPPHAVHLSGGVLDLAGFGVAVVTLDRTSE